MLTDPPPPVQYRSVTSPVAQETLSTSSCRRGNAGAGMGVKSSVVTARKKGEESASVLSNSDGIEVNRLFPDVHLDQLKDARLKLLERCRSRHGLG